MSVTQTSKIDVRSGIASSHILKAKRWAGFVLDPFAVILGREVGTTVLRTYINSTWLEAPSLFLVCVRIPSLMARGKQGTGSLASRERGSLLTSRLPRTDWFNDVSVVGVDASG